MENDVIQPNDIIVTEGINKYNLPLPYELIYNTKKQRYINKRISIYPNKDNAIGWKEKDKIFNGDINDYTYIANDENEPDNIIAHVKLRVKEARIISFLVRNQIGNTEINIKSRIIRVRVLKGTNLEKIYPIITLSDYTTCNYKYGDCLDFSNGPVEFIVESKTGNKYMWKVYVTEDNNIQNEIYVSTNGNDNNDGSLASPFRTFAKAQQYVRKINKNMKGNIVVNLSGGKYYLTDTIRMNENDSGTNGFSVIYKAYDDEKVTLFGGKKVTGWEKAADKPGAYKALAPKGVNYSRELYVNGKRTVIARDKGVDINGWEGYDDPNINWYDTNGYPKKLNNKIVHEGYVTNKLFKYNNMINWRNVSDIEFCYMVGWTYHIVSVDKIIKSKDGIIIYLKRPGFDIIQSNIGPLTVTDPNYIQNAFELLGEPGESYFDRSSKYIYYIPREGENLKNIEAYVPVLENLIIGTGKENKPISNIQFSKICFECSGYDRPHSSEGTVTGQASFLQSTNSNEKMSGALKFDYANNIIFDNCSFYMLGKAGLDFNVKSQNNIIMGCTFKGIASSAIQIGDNGTEKSKYTTLENAIRNNKVISNKISNVGESFRGGIGIWIGFANDTIIAFNEISNGSYSGISCGWEWTGFPTIAGNNIIEYNHVSTVLQKLQDGGGIYVLGYQPGSRIRGNHVHDTGLGEPGGIYFDEGSSGYTDISDNVIYRISERQPDCFYFNYNVGYWSKQIDRAEIVKHINNVMNNNFPCNKVTYPGIENRINPNKPDLNLLLVKATINNAGVHKAYK